MIPPGGLDCFSNGFLPATFQGSLFQRGEQPVADLQPGETNAKLQQGKLGLLRKLDKGVVERMGTDDKLESAISNYELAFRMQTAVPKLMDLGGETAATKALYGLDNGKTELFGRQCLIARRLVERGVRFIELLCPNLGHDRWDQHSNLKHGHDSQRPQVDVGHGLLKDLPRSAGAGWLVIWGRRVLGDRRCVGSGILLRSQSVRLHHLAGGRRRQGRTIYVCYRRLRLSR